MSFTDYPMQASEKEYFDARIVSHFSDPFLARVAAAVEGAHSQAAKAAIIHAALGQTQTQEQALKVVAYAQEQKLTRSVYEDDENKPLHWKSEADIEANKAREALLAEQTAADVPPAFPVSAITGKPVGNYAARMAAAKTQEEVIAIAHEAERNGHMIAHHGPN